MATISILLGSGGIRGEQMVSLYHRQMARHFCDVDEVLFIPYAAADHDRQLSRMQEFSKESGVKLVGIHNADDPFQAVIDAKAIYVGGGNTFLLTRDLHRYNLIPAIRQKVLHGTPYMGVSAGSNVAGPTMQTTNDMPIVMPKSFDTLDIVPFQINPHYIPGETWVKLGEEYVLHHGETRAQRIHEYHQHNETPVIGLREGTYLRWNGQVATLSGGEAVVHRPEGRPVTHEAETKFDGRLFPL